MVHRIVWRVASPDAIDFWAVRLADEGVDAAPRRATAWRFADPEGLEHELRVSDSDDAPLIADHPEVPREVALQGFDGVRAYASQPGGQPRPAGGRPRASPRPTARWEVRGDDRSGWLAYDAPPAERGSPSAGTVHHVAFASTMDDHEQWRDGGGPSTARGPRR